MIRSEKSLGSRKIFSQIQKVRALLCLTLISLMTSNITRAEEILVAVASNFHHTMKLISEEFQIRTGHTIILSAGSTKKQFTQIVNGAPFDFFVAADSETVERLNALQLSIENSSFNYAIGHLVILSASGSINPIDTLSNLKSGKIAIANPLISPYGSASVELLKNMGIWDSLKNNVVLGTNVEQTFQFVKTKNANVGIIAKSQLFRMRDLKEQKYWIPPNHLYTPIKQSAALLTDTSAAWQLKSFFETDDVTSLIKSSGYDLPK